MNYLDKIAKAKLWLKNVEGAQCHITERGQLRTNGLFSSDKIKYTLKVKKGEIKLYDNKGKEIKAEKEQPRTIKKGASELRNPANEATD